MVASVGNSSNNNIYEVMTNLDRNKFCTRNEDGTYSDPVIKLDNEEEIQKSFALQSFLSSISGPNGEYQNGTLYSFFKKAMDGASLDDLKKLNNDILQGKFNAPNAMSNFLTNIGLEKDKEAMNFLAVVSKCTAEKVLQEIEFENKLNNFQDKSIEEKYSINKNDNKEYISKLTLGYEV